MQSAQINQTFDLLSLAAQDTQLRRSGSSWWAGPCPFCGGTDRFTLKHTPSGWRWYCRGCGGDRYHTPLDYIMQRHSCTFRQALRYLDSPRLNVIASETKQSHRELDSPSNTAGGSWRGVVHVDSPHINVIANAAKQSPRGETNHRELDSPPSSAGGSWRGVAQDAWHTRARAFLDSATSALWSPTGVTALTWLHARGLRDDTIQRYHLGCNPHDLFDDLTAWGLPAPDDGKPHAVWLPRGIVIPCLENDRLWYLKIRRPVPASTRVIEKKSAIPAPSSSRGLGIDEPRRGSSIPKLSSSGADAMESWRQPQQKYVKIKGSQPALFGAANLQGAWLAVLTEGELDCLLLDQQAGELAGIASLGSASDRLSRLDLSIWSKYLLPVAHFLAAYDRDQAGEKGVTALAAFTERLHHALLPALPGVKDLTDYHLSGGDLSDWLCRTVEQLNLQP